MSFTSYVFIFSVAFFFLIAQWQPKSSKGPLFLGLIAALVPGLFILTLLTIVQLATNQPLSDTLTVYAGVVLLVQATLSCLAFILFERFNGNYLVWGLAVALSAAGIFYVAPLIVSHIM